MGRKMVEPIPPRPFQQLIEDLVAKGYTTEELVIKFGWDDGMKPESGLRKLYRYRYGRTESARGRKQHLGINGEYKVLRMVAYERGVVEEALFNADIQFEDVYKPELYPALYEDIPLEDEMFCAGCQDHCTPIRGVCPWCDGTILIPVEAHDGMEKAA